ncbi:MAG TPA: hypothetical protein VL882_14505, partial [Vicinamibacterales bacterium]|nr:hypothetical protein [Vicinamibacterales bacterium]
VPVEIFRDAQLRRNPHINVVVTRHGGHCGFVSNANGSDDGYWAERRLVEFAETLTAESLITDDQ